MNLIIYNKEGIVKNYLQTLLFFLALTQICSAQWFQQHIPKLRSVSFIDANTGTTVGEFGTIFQTTNGGAS